MSTVGNVPIVGGNFCPRARLHAIDDFARQLSDYYNKVLAGLESDTAQIRDKAADELAELVRQVAAYTFGKPYRLGALHLPSTSPLPPPPPHPHHRRIILTEKSKNSVLMRNMLGARMVLCARVSLVVELFARACYFHNTGLFFVKYLKRSIRRLYFPTHNPHPNKIGRVRLRIL